MAALAQFALPRRQGSTKPLGHRTKPFLEGDAVSRKRIGMQDLHPWSNGRVRSCGDSSVRFIERIATPACWKCEAIIATPDEATVSRPRPKSVCRNPLLKSFSHDGVSRCGSSRNYPRSHDSSESGDFCFRRKGAGETVRSLGSSPRQMTFPLYPICVEPMTKQGRTFECEPCRQIIIFFKVSDASRYIILCRNLFTDALAPNVRPYPAGALIHQSEPHHTALERR